MTREFKKFNKIRRAKNPFDVTITEKMDGTNACVVVTSDDIYAQSRKRIITPNSAGVQSDNFGFAKWVQENQIDLRKLGEGRHYGEWAGPGIQKNPHNLEEKRFFLFNTSLWNNDDRPDCCSVVPLIAEGNFGQQGDFKPLSDRRKNLWPSFLANEADFGVVNPFGYEIVADYFWDKEQRGERSEGVIIYWHFFETYTKHTLSCPDGKWSKGAREK